MQSMKEKKDNKDVGEQQIRPRSSSQVDQKCRNNRRRPREAFDLPDATPSA